MIPDQNLHALEALTESKRAQIPGSVIHVSTDVLRQLIAAARVANAAARVERDRADVRASHREGGNVTHLNIARAALASALRHYTAPRPVEVPR